MQIIGIYGEMKLQREFWQYKQYLQNNQRHKDTQNNIKQSNRSLT